jgi:hypothetical protein
MDTVVQVRTEMGKLLTGKIAGRRDFAKACALLINVEAGSIVVFDFTGVEYVSSSWLNWMLVPLIEYAAEEKNDFYLLVKNFPAVSLDDLQFVADQTHTPTLVMTGGKKATVVGPLDSVQKETLKAVQALGSATGASLSREDDVKPTTWNNRLRDLNIKRLLRREKVGREQIYSPIVSEVNFNG